MKKIIIFICLLQSTFVFGYINIYPTSFDKDITNGASSVFKLYNRLDKAVRYRIYVERDNVEYDLSPWMEIYPQSILLNPLEEKELKLLITPSADAKNGIYSAKLVIKQVNVPRMKREKQVNFMTILKMKIKGKFEKEGKEKK